MIIDDDYIYWPYAQDPEELFGEISILQAENEQLWSNYKRVDELLAAAEEDAERLRKEKELLEYSNRLLQETLNGLSEFMKDAERLKFLLHLNRACPGKLHGDGMILKPYEHEDDARATIDAARKMRKVNDI